MNAQAKEIPSTAIAEYSPTAAALADIATRMAKVVYDVSSPAGLAAARKDRAEVRDLRVALEKKRVEIKAPALKRCNEIDTEARRITAELLKYETPPDDAIKAEERRIEAERKALVEREEARVNAITGRIEDMRGAVNGALRARTSVEVLRILADVQKVAVDDSQFAEFKDTAALVQRESLAELERIRDDLIARETEAERLRKDREAFDRQRAEQEAKDKVERERVAAEQKEARDKFEAEQATARESARKENERIAAGQAAAQEIIDAQRRELEARQQAERDAQAERERVAREAEERRVATELEQRRRDEALAEAQRLANYRPSFDEIVLVLADHYKRDVAIVRQWIAEGALAQ
jgi:colicin import membrane protein